MTEQEYIAEFTQAVDRLKLRHGHANLAIPFTTLLALIGQVQLALRHPSNSGVAAKGVRAWIEGVIRLIARDEPTLGQMLTMGFDPAHDVTR